MFTTPKENIILLSDSYKVSHWKQYPPKTTNVYSYFESRGGMFKETVFFGLQYVIKKYLLGRVTYEEIAEAEKLYGEHFGTPDLFNRAGWEHIIREHHGYLPVRIKAVPEGMRVKTNNVLMTIENTCPDCYWLTNFLETILSQVWYPTTVATLSNETRKVILAELKATGTPEQIDFKLHDFGFRGVSSVESAGIGGAAHLVNFLGTDTVRGIVTARDYYGSLTACGFSIPASEHSTITSWGKFGEIDAYRNIIEQYGDMPLYACVSDSFDIYKAAGDLWGTALRDEVLNAAGTLVVRPDSGVPSIVVPNLLKILGEKFGYDVNKKGYKVLNAKVRVIQGDGMSYASIQQLLATMRQQGWSADNVAFGMGGGLLQNVNRDTQKFAFKCSNVVVDGVSRIVYKDPATDPGKVSKKGRLQLVQWDGDVHTVNESDVDHGPDLLELVYENGHLVRDDTLTNIRKRATV